MKKIFIVYGHYNDASFNSAIKKTFIDVALEKGHEIDCVDLYKEKFDPVFSGEEPDEIVIDHRKRIQKNCKPKKNDWSILNQLCSDVINFTNFFIFEKLNKLS